MNDYQWQELETARKRSHIVVWMWVTVLSGCILLMQCTSAHAMLELTLLTETPTVSVQTDVQTDLQSCDDAIINNYLNSIMGVINTSVNEWEHHAFNVRKFIDNMQVLLDGMETCNPSPSTTSTNLLIDATNSKGNQ